MLFKVFYYEFNLVLNNFTIKAFFFLLILFIESIFAFFKILSLDII